MNTVRLWMAFAVVSLAWVLAAAAHGLSMAAQWIEPEAVE